MRHSPFVADRQSALDAAQLVDDFGEGAGAAAAARAVASRDRGNLLNFCRWRQIERLIAVLREESGEQTRH